MASSLTSRAPHQTGARRSPAPSSNSAASNLAHPWWVSRSPGWHRRRPAQSRQAPGGPPQANALTRPRTVADQPARRTCPPPRWLPAREPATSPPPRASTNNDPPYAPHHRKGARDGAIEGPPPPRCAHPMNPLPYNNFRQEPRGSTRGRQVSRSPPTSQRLPRAEPNREIVAPCGGHHLSPLAAGCTARQPDRPSRGNAAAHHTPVAHAPAGSRGAPCQAPQPHLEATPGRPRVLRRSRQP